MVIPNRRWTAPGAVRGLWAPGVRGGGQALVDPAAGRGDRTRGGGSRGHLREVA